MDLQTIQLFRTNRSDQGTFGVIIAPGLCLYTGELPWRDNKQNISCIPDGEYLVNIKISPKYGKIYHVNDVPGRSNVLIHWGNWSGDVSMGYRSNVAGCIILGLAKGVLAGQLAVLNSRLAVKKFMKVMGNEPFRLKIIEMI